MCAVCVGCIKIFTPRAYRGRLYARTALASAPLTQERVLTIEGDLPTFDSTAFASQLSTALSVSPAEVNIVKTVAGSVVATVQFSVCTWRNASVYARRMSSSWGNKV